MITHKIQTWEKLGSRWQDADNGDFDAALENLLETTGWEPALWRVVEVGSVEDRHRHLDPPEGDDDEDLDEDDRRDRFAD